MPALFKGAVAAGAAAALWLTANLGQAWWALLVLLAIDALLNWRDESRFWTKLAYVVVTTAAGAHVQAGTGIPTLHLIVIGLVAFELPRVVEQLLGLIQTQLARGKIDAPTAAALTALVKAQAAKIAAMEAAAAATEPTPGSLRDLALQAVPAGGKTA